jgi:16S rRNA (adenine1518-N6/adenine1519-N6)-dimethyltransferase
MPRRLGQHFLVEEWVAKLLDSVAPASADAFLEIGPGRGALTLPLAQRCRQVVAVEIDPELAAGLQRVAPPNVEVLTADALALDLRPVLTDGMRLVGNLPYYVSSPLLRRFLDWRDRLRDAHLMLQEEVAERVAAAPGSRDYGILSVLYALWADVDVVLRLPPGAFRPPPKVRSAVVRVRFRAEPRAPVADLRGFERLLRQAFARRRRTLENNLRDSYPNLKEYLRFLDIEGTRRAETLSVVEFARLYTALAAE